MKNLKLSQNIDSIFRTLILIILYILWIRYFFEGSVLVIFLSCFLAILTNYLINIYILKKNIKTSTNNLDKFLIEKYAIQLFLLSSKSQYNFIKKIFPADYIFENKKILTYKKEDKKYNIFVSEKLEMDNDECLKILKESSEENLIIICNKINPDSLLLLKNINNKNITILNKNDMYYKFYKKLQIYPISNISFVEKNKTKLKDIADFAFEKRKAKKYFFASLILAFSSLIIPYNVYYLIFSTLLLVFSLICLIKKDENFINDFLI